MAKPTYDPFANPKKFFDKGGQSSSLPRKVISSQMPVEVPTTGSSFSPVRPVPVSFSQLTPEQSQQQSQLKQQQANEKLRQMWLKKASPTSGIHGPFYNPFATSSQPVSNQPVSKSLSTPSKFPGGGRQSPSLFMSPFASDPDSAKLGKKPTGMAKNNKAFDAWLEEGKILRDKLSRERDVRQQRTANKLFVRPDPDNALSKLQAAGVKLKDGPIARDELERKIFRHFDPDSRTGLYSSAAKNLGKARSKVAELGSKLQGGKTLGIIGATMLAPVEAGLAGASHIFGKMGEEGGAIHRAALKSQVPVTRGVRNIVGAGEWTAKKGIPGAAKGVIKGTAKTLAFAGRHPLLVGIGAMGIGAASNLLSDIGGPMAIGGIAAATIGEPDSNLGMAGMAYLSSIDKANDLQGVDLAKSAMRPNRPEGPMSFGGGGSSMGGGRNYTMGASGNLALSLNNLRRGG